MLEELFEELKRYIDAKFEELKASQSKDIHDVIDAEEVAKFIESKKEPERDVIDIKEAAEFTRLSISSLYYKTHKGTIPYYKRGQKVYFRRSELEKWMTENRVKTNAELNSEAALYVATSR